MNTLVKHHHTPKKGVTSKCENYRTLRLVCHVSNIVLEIIRNQIKPCIEAQIAAEQAGFRPGSGQIEQIFSLRLLAENYLGIPDGVLYNIFIDFKKPSTEFDMKAFGEKYTLMAFNQVQSLWEGAILTGLNKQLMLDIYLEHVMREALEGMVHIGASINDNIGINLCFANDIALIPRQLGDLQHLLNNVEEVVTC